MKINYVIDPEAGVVRFEARAKLDILPKVVEVPFAVFKIAAGNLFILEAQVELAARGAEARRNNGDAEPHAKIIGGEG